MLRTFLIADAVALVVGAVAWLEVRAVRRRRARSLTTR